MRTVEQITHRRSIRLKNYDYSSAGEYFVTICSHDRKHLFGEIVGEEIRLNEYGLIVQQTWHDLIHHIPNIELDEFVCMPNHVHGIIVILDAMVGAGSEPAPTGKRYTLSEIVRQFKTFSAKHINEKRKSTGIPVWQRNYYEHIIRDDNDLYNTREYILNNPLTWFFDEENLKRDCAVKESSE
jgi:REP element-mobilizing transposase RayT